MARLARHTGGNTLAMMAAAMIPIAAIAGSTIDTARLYVVKVRLQQACDAGVLAGRKFMVSSNATALEQPAATQATTFFNNNFRTGWMQTKAVRFTPVKTADQQVSATAFATVPMTIMKMFAAKDVQLKVACEARYDVADTDIVFVLDTTGSMACLPSDDETTCSNYVGQQVNNNAIQSFDRPANSSPHQTAGYAGSKGYAVPEKTGSRIDALREAVKNFYDTMDDNVDPTTNIRYGFVSYASSVNAGAAIMAASPAYMIGGSGSGATEHRFQSREVTGDYTASSTNADTSFNQAQCNSRTAGVRTPSASSTTSTAPWTYDSTSGTATIVTHNWVTSGTTSKCVKTTRIVGPQWTHREVAHNVVNYVAGQSVQDPTKIITADKTRWLGCIEERQTTAGISSFDTNALPADLDPNLIPNSPETRWRPMWPEVTYTRNYETGWFQYNGRWYSYKYYGGTGDDVISGDNDDQAPWYGLESRQRNGNVACGKPIRRLAEMTEAQVDAYVDAVDFRPIGGTYHDVGMIWGTRLLSPRGIFANDTIAHPGRQAPKRVLVFLTDGDMAPTSTSLSLYGVEWFSRRVTGGDFDDIKDYHNARFLAECEAAKALNIDVWTVAIGLESTDELKKCATTQAQALWTDSGAGLSAHFEKIAKQVAMLRVSR